MKDRPPSLAQLGLWTCTAQTLDKNYNPVMCGKLNSNSTVTCSACGARRKAR